MLYFGTSYSSISRCCRFDWVIRFQFNKWVNTYSFRNKSRIYMLICNPKLLFYHFDRTPRVILSSLACHTVFSSVCNENFLLLLFTKWSIQLLCWWHPTENSTDDFLHTVRHESCDQRDEMACSRSNDSWEWVFHFQPSHWLFDRLVWDLFHLLSLLLDEAFSQIWAMHLLCTVHYRRSWIFRPIIS